MSFFAPKPYFHLMAKPGSFHCNIQCEYCFYLGKSAQFGKQAPFMSIDTLKNYIQQYINAHDSESVEFMWQGGEPTLLGLDFFQQAVRFQQKFSNGKRITNAFQTNGIALNQQWAAFFKQHHFLIGLSIDGLAAVHNRYRLSTNGNPTFEKVVRAIELLKQYEVDFNTLTVVNDQNQHKGKQTYLALKALDSTFMQFIPIVETTCNGQVTPFSVSPTGYGEFLFDVFQEWYKQDRGKIFVLTFDHLLGQYLGYPSANCVHQPTCGKSLVVEANGDIYACDHFVSPEYRLGNLNHNPLPEMVISAQQRQFGENKATKLTALCRHCEFKPLCHGGCPKHRIITVDAEAHKHNYLCPSYRYFFRQTAPYMQAMRQQIQGAF
ncbi:anaerobic sulfatase maturase [Rodentibacter myodis]|uniref:Anaerobic sulfatase maturase n=1 Tax=Rodentibacter myodis TaxID=1907939 RepID=A0A1V3JQ01_9PAST|nr:anaerobic sulfatase maturase [Rodentibacter myodis]OOF58738.1 anaerobic sulfatase maturase [Rodentibacter myodis]